MVKRIIGVVKYMDFEMGFWGIETEDKMKYLPINMPEQLKIRNTKISCSIFLFEEMMTMNNWGQPCKVISFSTILISNH